MFEARVSWSPVREGRFSVRWSMGPVTGVLQTNVSWAHLPLPPLSSASVQVTDLITGDVSESLVVHSPDIIEEEEEEEEVTGEYDSAVVILIATVVSMVSLVVILIIAIHLQRLKGSLVTSHHERDLVSFETFIRENRIAINDSRVLCS